MRGHPRPPGKALAGSSSGRGRSATHPAANTGRLTPGQSNAKLFRFSRNETDFRLAVLNVKNHAHSLGIGGENQEAGVESLCTAVTHAVWCLRENPSGWSGLSNLRSTRLCYRGAIRRVSNLCQRRSPKPGIAKPEWNTGYLRIGQKPFRSQVSESIHARRPHTGWMFGRRAWIVKEPPSPLTKPT